jgi:hypothetical protein
MYQLKMIRPVQLNDLVRIGKRQDGGYVISQRQLDGTKVLLSFGISTDWSFDDDFLHRSNNVALYAYDYSVSAHVLRKRIVKSLCSAIYSIFTQYFHTAKERISFATEKILHPFQRFFNPAKNRWFFKKYLGNHDSDEYVSVNTVFGTHLKHRAEDLSVFVKMDIEESEYRTLPAFKPFYHLINGFAIEFHNLDILGNNFTEIVREMSEYFYVAHVHANNYDRCIYPDTLPKTLEITFINKQLVPETPVDSTRSYPIPGLDFPCDPKFPDVSIVF